MASPGPDAGRRDAPRRDGRPRGVAGRPLRPRRGRSRSSSTSSARAGPGSSRSSSSARARRPTSTLPITYTPAPGFAGPGGTLDPKSASRDDSRGARDPRGRRPRVPSLPRDVDSAATPDSPVAGSVTLGRTAAGKVDDLYLIARTYTRAASGGTFGLFYGGPSDLDAAEEEATVYGLRSVRGRGALEPRGRPPPGARHGPDRGLGAGLLRERRAGGSPARQDASRRASGRSGTASSASPGLPEGSYGYARIRRTAGVGAFAAYGVVNDARTSDGSYLPAFRPAASPPRGPSSSRSSSTSTATRARTSRPR